MKAIPLLASLALALFCLSGCEPKQQASRKAGAESAAPLQVVKINVEGMSCPVGCAPQVKEQLASVDGVTKVEVDFEAKLATVETSKQVDEKDLLAALKDPFKGEIEK
ncbi:MAG: heavy-metal-associated domain-containing protein [Planctomycetes bacterium]|nr:heavy-metal-associated domain-containing protein [Planctomycetota bacterium]